MRQLQVVVAGYTDDPVPTQPSSGGLQVRVVTPQMHALGAGLQAQIEIIVDDEDGVMGLTQLQQGSSFFAAALVIGRFVAILQDAAAAAQCGFGLRQQRPALNAVHGDGVQPGKTAHEINLPGMNWPAPGWKPFCSAFQVYS